MAIENNTIDKKVPVPLYFQLKELILKEIKSGSYPEGSMIPTEKELGDMFQISRTTVRQAIAELVNEGWLYRVKSKGTFVSRPKIQQDFMNKIESFTTEMERKGFSVSTEVLDFKVTQADEITAGALKLKAGDKVIYLYRKRCTDGEPIVTIETFLPYKDCEFLMGTDFTHTTLYSKLDESEETRIDYMVRKAQAVGATAADAKLLNMKKGEPIHFFISTGFNKYGKPIEYSLSRYRGDRSEFEVTVVRK